MFASVHSASPAHVDVVHATAWNAAVLAVTIIEGAWAAAHGSIALIEHAAASPRVALRLGKARRAFAETRAPRARAGAAAAAASRFHRRGRLKPAANADGLASAPTSSMLSCCTAVAPPLSPSTSAKYGRTWRRREPRRRAPPGQPRARHTPSGRLRWPPRRALARRRTRGRAPGGATGVPGGLLKGSRGCLECLLD